MKYSRVERNMNRYIIYVFVFLTMECLFSSAFYNIWYEEKKDELQSYLSIDSSDAEATPAYDFFLRIAMWFLLLSNSVPISLLVTLEMVKFVQGLITQSDRNFKFNNRLATVNSSNLSEELGVVDFIFSDKTGTLTCNIMKFKGMSIFGKKYGIDGGCYINSIKKQSN